MSILNKLLESRTAPLYHASMDAEDIMESNDILAETEHTINNKEYYGVSLSRDLRFLLANGHIFGEVIFELDQSKLANNYKIIPFNYFYDSEENNKNNSYRRGDTAEAEEFLIGAISPLDRYLTGIIVDEKNIKKLGKKIKSHPLLKIYSKGRLRKINESVEETTSDKTRQFEIISKHNPMRDDIHTGIRSANEIKTFEETFNDTDSFMYPDFQISDAETALARNKITIYSSKQIELGTFVTPSKMNARDYAGDGKIYSKEVNPSEVAWINADEGQYTGNVSENVIISEKINMSETQDKVKDLLSKSYREFVSELKNFRLPSESINKDSLDINHEVTIKSIGMILNDILYSNFHDFDENIDFQFTSSLSKNNALGRFTIASDGKRRIFIYPSLIFSQLHIPDFITTGKNGNEIVVESIAMFAIIDFFKKIYSTITHEILHSYQSKEYNKGKFTNPKSLLRVRGTSDDYLGRNVEIQSWAMNAADEIIDELYIKTSDEFKNLLRKHSPEEIGKISGKYNAYYNTYKNDKHGFGDVWKRFNQYLYYYGTHYNYNKNKIVTKLNEYGNITDNKKFMNWFRNSKVVDKSGKPQIVFHGTGKDFNKFEKTGLGAGSRESNIGYWFTENNRAAHDFAAFAARGTGANILPVYLRIENPWLPKEYKEIRDLVDEFTDFSNPKKYRMVQDTVHYDEIVKHLKSKGFDGIILKDTITDSPDGVTKINQYMIFDKNQVKSIFNKEFNDESEFISEDAVSDAKHSSYASSQFYNILMYLRGMNVTELFNDKNIAIQKGDYPIINGTIIGDNDLLIMLKDSDGYRNGAYGDIKPGTPYYTRGFRKVIVLNVLSNNASHYALNLQTIPDDVDIGSVIASKMMAGETTFIHEYTHYMDFKRFKNKNSGAGETLVVTDMDYKKYYNTPEEFNAFFTEGLNKFLNTMKSHDIQKRKRYFSIFPTFETFIARGASAFWDAGFLQFLDEKYRKKFNKRLYAIYKYVLDNENIVGDDIGNQINEFGVGKIVKGVNTTKDVGVNHTQEQAKKLRMKINKYNIPPILGEDKQ